MADRGEDTQRLAIRAAKPLDVPALKTFFEEAWNEAGPDALGFTGATEEAIHDIASKRSLHSLVARTDRHVVVALKGGRVLGFSALKALGPGVAELSGIVVLESATGKGIGTRLLRKSGMIARKKGYERIIVKTETNNERAINFYKKMGFSETKKVSEDIGKTKVKLLVLEETIS